MQWYQNLNARLGVGSLLRGGCIGAVMTADLMAPAFLPPAAAFKTVDIRLIQKCENIASFRIRLFVVEYARWETRESQIIHVLWWEDTLCYFL